MIKIFFQDGQIRPYAIDLLTRDFQEVEKVDHSVIIDAKDGYFACHNAAEYLSMNYGNEDTNCILYTNSLETLKYLSLDTWDGNKFNIYVYRYKPEFKFYSESAMWEPIHKFTNRELKPGMNIANLYMGGEFGNENQ